MTLEDLHIVWSVEREQLRALENESGSPLGYAALNHVAAVWWASRLEILEKREVFCAALELLLPQSDYLLYVDYDPDDTLLTAMRSVDIECQGCMFSAVRLLPVNTGLRCENHALTAKEGYGQPWLPVDVDSVQLFTEDELKRRA